LPALLLLVALPEMLLLLVVLLPLVEVSLLLAPLELLLLLWLSSLVQCPADLDRSPLPVARLPEQFSLCRILLLVAPRPLLLLLLLL
jgi:hypothetical protein